MAANRMLRQLIQYYIYDNRIWRHKFHHMTW